MIFGGDPPPDFFPEHIPPWFMRMVHVFVVIYIGMYVVWAISIMRESIIGRREMKEWEEEQRKKKISDLTGQ